MKCLVTGGAGFIGSHLCEALLREGHQVTALDDLSTGRRENLADLLGRPDFRFVEGSVTDDAVTKPLVEAADEVYHLAAAVGVRLVVERPVHTIQTNIRGTEVVLAAAAPGRRRVLITSTSEVYGKGDGGKLTEDSDMRLGPSTRSRWCYACSKALDEYLGFAYWKEQQLPVTLVRLFNTVGPRQVGTYGMVLPRFVQQALAGGPITVYDDGQMVRCFLHVHDAVDALIKLNRHPKAPGQLFNIGTEEAVTMLQLAERVRDAVGGGVKIQFVPYEKAYESGFEDIRRRVPDTSRIRGLIGFRPRYNLDQIIAGVIAYYRESKEGT